MITNPYHHLKNDFPLLQRESPKEGSRFCFLDNASTTLKPQPVIDAVCEYLSTYPANVHRGVYKISERASQEYEAARVKVQKFIGAPSPRNIVFTRGTTDGINLLSLMLSGTVLNRGDKILVSPLEHHANIIPWLMRGAQYGYALSLASLDEFGDIVYNPSALNDPSIKLISIIHTSNVTGSTCNVKEWVSAAKPKGIPVLIDAAQSIAHGGVNVSELGLDFMVFSGHKLYGPTGIGVLYISDDWLDRLPACWGGGAMIESVSFDSFTTAPPPQKFEPGTPPIAEAIGLGAAIDYFEKNIFKTGEGLAGLNSWEQTLRSAALEGLKTVPGVKVFDPHSAVGSRHPKGPVISFAMKSAHPHDIASLLDESGVAVRAGHHCCQPLMKLWGVSATTRASFSFYNDLEDVEALIEGLHFVRKVMGL